MDLVSFVFQDVHLFYDTIEANIRMGNRTASRKLLEKLRQWLVVMNLLSSFRKAMTP